jgi:hypothetical protein
VLKLDSTAILMHVVIKLINALRVKIELTAGIPKLPKDVIKSANKIYS